MNNTSLTTRLAALALIGTLSACAIPRDVPSESSGKGSVLDQFADLQSRLNKLNSTGQYAVGTAADAPAVTGEKYAWAKAQCWLRNGYSERHENDAGGFATQSLTEAQKIIENLEAGKPTGQSTALVNHSERLRNDLWQSAESLKQHKGYACVAPVVACLEVQLSRAGHEQAAIGWRHANPYLAIAEDMAAKAHTQADACKIVPVVAPAVVSPPVPVPQVAVTKAVEKFSLSAGALFKFDKRNQADLLPQGKAEMDDMARRIKTVYVSVESIQLVGYTDRLGSDSYNQKLSEDRANTVKAYLPSQGVNGAMSASGLGKANPVVQCEGKQATPQLTQCLQSNRRVEITVTGIKR
jgi:OmpA-OmpF porin, OOP family